MNAAAGAKAHHAAGQAVRSGRLGAGALNPGSYASLGRVRAKLSTPLVAVGNAKTDSRGEAGQKWCLSPSLAADLGLREEF